MRRFLVAVGIVALVFCALPVTPVGAVERPPVAYVLVDHDTGNVLAASNERAALPPASITKLLTALVVVANTSPEQQISVSAQAARMPAMKIGLTEGETWNRNDLLYSLMLVSANDAAVALAEATSGSLQEFAVARSEAARRLGLQDNPVFKDPAGLDDAEFSFEGGDRVSARDMAIVARAGLTDPLVSRIVSAQRYEFFGGDHKGHTLKNHNKMLATYSGSVGVKTGYTSKARNTMVAAATRDGRTMVAVVLGADSPYTVASALLDQGFATPADQQPLMDNLPLATLTPQLTQPVVHLASQPDESGQTWARIGGVIFIVGFIGVFAWKRYREASPRFRMTDMETPVKAFD